MSDFQFYAEGVSFGETAYESGISQHSISWEECRRHLQEQVGGEILDSQFDDFCEGFMEAFADCFPET